jgi:hypothetical protein
MRSRQPYNGMFFPAAGSDTGHLTLAGKDSALKIAGKEEPPTSTTGYHDIHGTLSNGKKATLLQCLCTGTTQYRWGSGARHETIFFPHYVVLGEEFINSTDAVISAIAYHFEHASSMVNGHRTFHSIRPEPEQVRRILEADHIRREKIAESHGWDKSPFDPEIGEHPELLYFSGVWEIIRCNADLGTVTLYNQTSHGMGGAKGIGFENQIAAKIEFSSPKTLPDAVNSLYTLHSLFELSLGRRQRYLWIELDIVNSSSGSVDRPLPPAELWWSNCNERVDGETPPTHFADILIDAEGRPEEFVSVTSAWLNSASSMGDARNRFATAFHGAYSINRIVGAANMFDLLPEDRASKKIEVHEATQEAVKQCKAIFKALPESSARQSVLSALGRVGTASLRDKVLHRASILTAASGSRFTEIHIPCSQAVLCRNHYVHGSRAGFDYNEEFGAFAFLTNTLEFVFAASDLIELGWNFEAWRTKGSSMTHDFGSYVLNYDENLRRLKALLAK